MNAYPAEQAWRQTATMLLRLIAFVVFLAAIIGLGWAVWDYLINNPLPYRDPEAIRAVRPPHGGQQSDPTLRLSSVAAGRVRQCPTTASASSSIAGRVECGRTRSPADDSCPTTNPGIRCAWCWQATPDGASGTSAAGAAPSSKPLLSLCGERILGIGACAPRQGRGRHGGGSGRFVVAILSD